MYKIKCDGYLLHDDVLQDKRLQDIKLTLELNQFNSLEFTIYPQHEYYDKLQKLKSIITLERDEEVIFRGRILEYKKGFRNQLSIVCEGELGFLLDSIVRPYEYNGNQRDYFAFLINQHNEQLEPEKQFVVGDVTAISETVEVSQSNTEHLTTWAAINEIINKTGGYLTVDFDDEGNRRINYITEADFRLSNQEINFGENLINLETESKGSEIATAIIALGGKIEGSTPEKRLDITTLIDGQIMETEEDGDIIEKKDDYVYSHKAVEKYGWIFKTVTYDDVESDKEYLQTVATTELLQAIKSTESIELNAIDIAKLKLNVNSFNVATRVLVTSPKHNYEKALFPVTKITLNLLKPTSNTLSLQKTSTTFTEKSINNSKANDQASKIIMVESNVSGLEQKADSNAATIAETTEELTSLINQTAEEILSQMSEKHYLKEQTNALVQNVETQIKQTNDEIEFRFNTFNQNVQDVQAGTDSRFQEISKYIRFEDGNIILGEEGNELTLNIQNDRVSFLDHNTEVAYFSNRKLYVLDGEFLNVLRLGSFVFTPQANGSVSFKKVT